MIELRGTFQAWLQQRKDQVVNLDSYSLKPLQCHKILIYYDDDDDEGSSTPLRDIIISELPPYIAITPVLSTKEPKDSLIMGDEHLDTILEKESEEFIKSSVENLVPNPSESEDKRECDVPVCDDFTTFSNLLFDADNNFSSSDDESFSNEDISKEIYSNPLFDEEIISIKIDPHHFSAKSDLIEPLLNQDSLIISSSKIDSLLDEFASELMFLKSIPPGIDEADCDPEKEIRLIKKLLYDNSSPRPPEEINSENSDVIIESFSPSPIPVEDRDNLFPERLLHDDPIPLPDILDFSNVVRIPPSSPIRSVSLDTSLREVSKAWSLSRKKVQNRVGNASRARQVKCYNCNGIRHIARNCTQPKCPQNSDYFKDKMLLMQAQENGMALDKEHLLFLACGQDNAIDEDVDEQPVQDLALNMDNVFQFDDCDSFDSDVDEAPMTQTMFMANLSFADPVNDEAGPSYDSNILSEYVKDNAVPIVHSNVSSVPNDAYMMIYNDMYEPHAQSVFKTSRNTVVENSLSAELATYKEQVELYERRARFELTEREQKINEQLRLVISDRNFKEETLKKELHYVKLQLTSTINHNKLMVEEVTSLKKDFKQKENKYLEDFLDMKSLKEKVAIGYKNPLCLTRTKEVHPALYNGHEIIKDNHVSAIVHNIEDTLEIAKITRRKMNDKMKDPECVNHKVKIAPHDYSKENFLATFKPQKQLTPEQIFWSHCNAPLRKEDVMS
nr:retrovirus-related Pol polyprotein from transposon TNT 1-94 [Tanacetum cinerariifolium]